MSARPVCRDTDLSDTRPPAGRLKVEVAKHRTPRHGSADIAHCSRPFRRCHIQSCLSRYPRDPIQPVAAITRRQLRHEFRIARIPSRKERAISSDRGVLRDGCRAAPKRRLCCPPRGDDDDPGPLRGHGLRAVMIYWRARPINGHRFLLHGHAGEVDRRAGTSTASWPGLSRPPRLFCSLPKNSGSPGQARRRRR